MLFSGLEDENPKKGSRCRIQAVRKVYNSFNGIIKFKQYLCRATKNSRKFRLIYPNIKQYQE